jgi:hypothetical protein
MKENANQYDRIVLTYKQINVTFNNRHKCELHIEVGTGQLKPLVYLSITAKSSYDSFTVGFEFPFELRKVAWDTFEELTVVMNRVGLIDTASKLEETPQSAT